jgi:bifunctional DNA-binding transcriptional regulator/antitoxin component of YhaV-PrlF toxin-antitoxin module
MVLAKVGQKYTLSIPAPFRSLLPVGQEVAISADAQGRLIIAPVEQVRSLLMETFGMWTDRTDLPTDSVEYVNGIRRGRRLDEMGAQERGSQSV